MVDLENIDSKVSKICKSIWVKSKLNLFNRVKKKNGISSHSFFLTFPSSLIIEIL